MSLAIFVSPKLVSILDPNSNPIDVWVIEFPFWLAKYLCEQKAQNESDQQVNESFQSVSPVYHYSDANEEELLAAQCVPDVYQYEQALENVIPLELEENTFAENPVNYNPIVGYPVQSPNMAQFQNDFPICVHANLALPSNNFSATSLPFHPHQSDDLNKYQQLPEEQTSENCYQIYPESSTIYQPENWSDSLPYFPDSPFLPVGLHQGVELQVSPSNFSNGFSIPENCMIHTADNGSFFIENKLSEISGFVSGKLLDWGFSHPLGHVLKNKRGLSCCFILHSGTPCYVKFTPYSIKFSSNQRGIAYVIDEAGVRTCWESFKSFEELISERDDKWEKIDRPQVVMNCGCGVSSCFHQVSSKEMWKFTSNEEKIRIERKGLRFFSETRELKNLHLDLEDYHLNSTLRHIGEPSGQIYVKSCQFKFNQSAFFNGKSLQVKFHTQSACLDSCGQLSL